MCVKNYWFIISILFLCITPGFLAGQCSEQELAYPPGEKITYEIAYNWGFIWVDAGEAYFKIDTSSHKGKPALLFEAFGTSYQYYDWLYKVRDIFQSKVDASGVLPAWFLRKTYEGGYEVYNEYDFDYENQQISIQFKDDKKPQVTVHLPLDDCRFDVLSAVYFVRNINYDNYKVGDKIPVKIIINDAFYETYVCYLGKEIIRNRSGKKYRCHKMSAMLVEGTIFKEGEDLVVWVTDDKNKIPIMAEAKILIGSVKAYLTGYEGLKYEMECEIKEPR
jgi:hypothetical protein